MKPLHVLAFLAPALVLAGCPEKSKPAKSSTAPAAKASARPAAPAYKLTTLKAQPLAPASAPQTVAWGKKVRVTLPAGAIRQADEMKISSIDAPPAHQNKWVKQLAVYDVSLGKTARLDRLIDIEIAFDQPPAGGPRLLWLSYWDKHQGIWVAIPSQVDRKRNVVRGQTDHLCPVAVMAPTPEEAAQAAAQLEKRHYANDYFALLFNKAEVVASTCGPGEPRGFRALIDPAVPVIRADMPAYPEHVLHYLTTARERYCSAAPAGAGFRDLKKFASDAWIDTGGTLVSVGGEGSSSRGKVTGALSITLAKNGWPPLKTEVAHELFHCVQGRYFTAAGMGARKWWIEATADYAADVVAQGGIESMGGDKINPRFLEVPLTYASSVIYDTAQTASEYVAEAAGYRKDAILSEDPHGYHEYTSAFFIEFLCGKKKIDFREMFEAVAKSWNPSVETPLDAFLKTKGTSLEECHREFAQWWAFAPDSPLYRRKLVSDLKVLSEPGTGTLILPIQNSSRQTLSLKAGRTGKLWCFKVAPANDRSNRTITFTAALRLKRDEEPAAGWIAYVYLLKGGTPPTSPQTPAIVLDPGPAGKSAVGAGEIVPAPDDMVCVLALNEHPSRSFDVTLDASANTPYRYCNINFLVQGQARWTSTHPTNQDANWTKQDHAAMGNVIRDLAPVVMRGDEFTIDLAGREMGLDKGAKARLKGRFDKTRQKLEELTVSYERQDTMSYPTTVRKQEWLFRAGGIPRRERVYKDRDEFEVSYNLNALDPDLRKIPAGFQVLGAAFSYDSLSTWTIDDKPASSTLRASAFGQPTSVGIHLTFRTDLPQKKPPTTRKK